MVCALTVSRICGHAQPDRDWVSVVVTSELGALKVPLPGGRLVTPKVTVPLGLVASAGTVTVSWTVAVQVLVPPVGTLGGLQTRMGSEERRVGEGRRARRGPEH